MIDAILLGSGGTMPLDIRPLTSLYLHMDKHIVLVDCGEGTQVEARRLGIRISKISVICLTHLHADHVLGLPGLLLTMGHESRVRPLLIVGPVGIRKFIQKSMKKIGTLPFPLYYCELKDEFCSVDVGGVMIEAMLLKHDCPCYGYNFVFERAGCFNRGKAEASGLPEFTWELLQNKVTVCKDGREYTRFDLLGDDRSVKISYVTDTACFDSLVEFIGGANLAVLEGMYYDSSQVPADGRRVHMTMLEAAGIAREAGVGLLCLTHFSPVVPDILGPYHEVSKVFGKTIYGFGGLRLSISTDGSVTTDVRKPDVYVGMKLFRSILSGRRSYVTVDSGYYEIGDTIAVGCHWHGNVFTASGSVTDVTVRQQCKIVSFRLIMAGEEEEQ